MVLTIPDIGRTPMGNPLEVSNTMAKKRLDPRPPEPPEPDDFIYTPPSGRRMNLPEWRPTHIPPIRVPEIRPPKPSPPPNLHGTSAWPGMFLNFARRELSSQIPSWAKPEPLPSPELRKPTPPRAPRITPPDVSHVAKSLEHALEKALQAKGKRTKGRGR